jgi:hypothetical protein
MFLAFNNDVLPGDDGHIIYPLYYIYLQIPNAQHFNAYVRPSESRHYSWLLYLAYYYNLLLNNARWESALNVFSLSKALFSFFLSLSLSLSLSFFFFVRIRSNSFVQIQGDATLRDFQRSVQYYFDVSCVVLIKPSREAANIIRLDITRLWKSRKL